MNTTLTRVAKTKLIGSLALAAIIIAGGTVIVYPRLTKASTIAGRINKQTERTTSLDNQVSTLQRDAEQLTKERKLASAIQARFPSTADQPGLFKAIQTAAQRAGIPSKNVTGLTPSVPTVQPGKSGGLGLATMSVTVAVSGSYGQVIQFLRNLEAMPRAYLISSIQLAGANGSSQFTLNLSGTMFVMTSPTDPGNIDGK